MQKTRIALLQRMPIFGGIRDDILEFLLGLSSIVFVKKGSFFFREDDKAESFFVLESGSVSVLKSWKEQEYVLRNLVKGDCFGEMAVMDRFPRSAGVLALEDCTAIEVSNADLYSIYEHDLEQFTMIQMNMGREVSRRLREADERLFRAKVQAPDMGAHNIFRSA